jgi:hypothetical protein
VWSLKSWPVDVTLLGKNYTIPAMSAADWLGLLMSEPLYLDTIFPGLLDVQVQELVERKLHEGDMDLEEVYDTAFDIIATVSGRKWWVAMRLIQVARGSWDSIGGDMVRKADAERLSLAGWLDVLFIHLVRNIDDAKRTMFLMKLELPPEGWGDAQEELEMSADTFMSMAE